MEEWRNIQNYEGYQVSNTGRVRNINKGIILTQYNRSRNKLYKAVSIGSKLISVHRLVAQAFLPNPNNLPMVNHKDENPSNNLIWINEDGSIDYEKSNLEWCDAKYNCNYGTRIKRIADKNSRPIVSIDINGKETYYKSAFECYHRKGYQYSNILKCCKGQRYKAHKHKWMFVEDWLADWWEQEMENAEF